ncbi:hypothetical protein DBR45_05465 [Pseudomonas sp. HMWF031]|nr:hypothetical protein DBR45_05465 [Pseudomonas sp. HMWF031]
MSIDSTQIIPCTGWYYVAEDSAFATPVAAWTLLANGDVVGLIPTQHNPNNTNKEPLYPRLVTVPGKGKYVPEGLLPSGTKIV